MDRETMTTLQKNFKVRREEAYKKAFKNFVEIETCNLVLATIREWFRGKHHNETAEYFGHRHVAARTSGLPQNG